MSLGLSLRMVSGMRTALILAVLPIVLAGASEASQPRSRFLTALAKVKSGDDVAATVKLAGETVGCVEKEGVAAAKLAYLPSLPPGHVAYLFGKLSEVHRVPASGYVTADPKGKITYVSLNRALSKWIQQRLDEKSLVAGFSVIDSVPRFGSSSFSPVKVVRAANLLVKMGKDKACSLLAEYLMVAGSSLAEEEDRGVHVLLRCLFQSGDGKTVAPTCTGLIPVARPSTGLPVYPLVVVEGWPFDVSVGRAFGGGSYEPGLILEKLVNGSFREGMLVPNKNFAEVAKAVRASEAKVLKHLGEQLSARLQKGGVLRRKLDAQVGTIRDSLKWK